MKLYKTLDTNYWVLGSGNDSNRLLLPRNHTITNANLTSLSLIHWRTAALLQFYLPRALICQSTAMYYNYNLINMFTCFLHINYMCTVSTYTTFASYVNGYNTSAHAAIKSRLSQGLTNLLLLKWIIFCLECIVRIQFILLLIPCEIITRYVSENK